jgi:hypothetical protein
MSADTCRQLSYTEPRQAAVDAARLARGDAKPAPLADTSWMTMKDIIPMCGPRSRQAHAASAKGSLAGGAS